ncbi:DUF1800 domain-containing protein [Luteolibacter sp. LG18]|uniref:DUF1800 domain-containing protein n=1 Tax=Luteolibacter sp. LG18 TaxID=2819286 RepID=UPI002B2E8F87|nr:hypothetical protein llg_14790 [Luteolibacter sp. LG18]
MLPQASDTWTIYEAAHLLNRAGFGGSPADIKAFHTLGRTKAVDSLLKPAVGPDEFSMPEWCSPEKMAEDMQQRIAQLRQVREATKNMTPEEAEKAKKNANQAEQKENRQHGIEGQGWWFRAMLHTKAPLREKMTLFWHDHFATSIQKVKQPVLLMMQNALFRRNATGNFRQLTHEIAKNPAMMLYLDTQNSKKGKPNENFAREVMELFTLGEGHYTEQDIREAARAFTGYQLNRQNGTVFHNKRMWDEGEKTVFGKTGKFDGDDIVNLIFEQPQAAKFMAAKLWEYFAAEDPPASAVDALATTFREANYEVAPLLREIFLSKQFYSDEVVRNQIKCPIQFLIGMLKQLELNQTPQGYTMIAQQQLGQVLFNPPNVAGWDWGKAWINTNTLLTRYNVAGFITKGADKAPDRPLPGEEPMAMADKDGSMEMQDEDGGGKGAGKALGKKATPERVAVATEVAARNWRGPDYDRIVPRELRKRHEDLVDSLALRFFQAPLADKNRKRFIAFAEEKEGVVFTNHEVAELVHLMLSTPEYQLV